MALHHFLSLKLLSQYTISCVAISILSFPLSASISKQQECLVTSKQLSNSKNKLFVDVRDKQVFNNKHLVNSINIPFDLIRTKTFLKNKNIVIVGNGWNEKLLLEQCEELKKKGFASVQVLKGGIINSGKKLKLNNNKKSLTPLIHITSREFFNNKFSKKFIPIVISNENKKLILTMLPHAKIKRSNVSKNKLLKTLRKLGKGKNPIVFFSDESAVIDTAINEYLKKPKRKIYYFKGGFEAYSRIQTLNTMTALSKHKKRFSTKKPVSCAN